MLLSVPENHAKGISELRTNEEVRRALQAESKSITVGELAEFLRLHPSMQSHSSDIYRLLRGGKLAAFKLGSVWGFRREAVNHLVQRTSRQRSGS
jgi:hypothetical protein